MRRTFIVDNLRILFMVAALFGSASSQEQSNKLYDYFTMIDNGGAINEADIIDAFGRLIGLSSSASGAREKEDRIVNVFSRRILEMIQLVNGTKTECRREIKAALASLSVISYQLSTRCQSHLLNETEFSMCNEKKRNSLKEHIWVAKLMNAWGSPSSGLFAQGQFLWYGSYHQCVNTKVPRDRSWPQSARYCMVTIGPSFEDWSAGPTDGTGDSLRLRLQLGTCLPPSCVDHDRSNLMSSILHAIANGSGEVNPKIQEGLSNHRVFCQLPHQRSFSSGQLVVLVLLCALVVLVIAGTIVDYRTRQMAAKRQREKRLQRLLESVSEKGSIIDTQTTASGDWLDSSMKSHIDLESVISFKSQESLRRSIRRLKWWLRLITAFSIRMNAGWLVSNQPTMSNGERPCNRITCLYGIRVIAMIWVIVGHSYVFAMPHLSNLVEASERMPVLFLSQIVLNATLSVDTFYLISGLLNCYMWCIRQRKVNERGLNRVSTWLAYFGHRFARLAPPYMLVIAVVVSGLFSNLGHGPRWELDHISGIHCDRNTWWRHLLFVNNLVPGGERCLPWMWHLAIDVQCYIVAPFFIILLWKHPKIGCSVILLVVFGSALARGLVIGLMRLPTNLMLFLPQQHFNNDFYAYFDTIYQKPYFRCGPYLIGLLVGWMLATKTDQLRMWYRLSWKTKIFIWVLAVVFCFWPLFGLYPLLGGRFFSPVYNGVFAAVNRTVWSIGVAMVIVSCHCQFGCSYMNSVFSWIGWWPFARLNYGVYLIHELLIVYIYFNRWSPITYDGHTSLLAHFAFFTAMSYAAALILFIIVEGPTLAAERLLFRRKPNSKNNRHRAKKGSVLKEIDESVDAGRRRMTERWSAYANSEEKSTPSGAQLYDSDEGGQSKSVVQVVSAQPEAVETVESSMQVSLEHEEKGHCPSITASQASTGNISVAVTSV